MSSRSPFSSRGLSDARAKLNSLQDKYYKAVSEVQELAHQIEHCDDRIDQAEERLRRRKRYTTQERIVLKDDYDMACRYKTHLEEQHARAHGRRDSAQANRDRLRQEVDDLDDVFFEHQQRQADAWIETLEHHDSGRRRAEDRRRRMHTHSSEAGPSSTRRPRSPQEGSDFTTQEHRPHYAYGFSPTGSEYRPRTAHSQQHSHSHRPQYSYRFSATGDPPRTAHSEQYRPQYAHGYFPTGYATRPPTPHPQPAPPPHSTSYPIRPPQSTYMPSSQIITSWRKFVDDCFKDYSAMKDFPHPPVHHRNDGSAAWKKGVRATFRQVPGISLKKESYRWHPDKFSSCEAAKKETFQKYAQEVFVVLNEMVQEEKLMQKESFSVA